MERVLIYIDRNGATTFQKAIEATQQSCNYLISTFEAFQDWKKIEIIHDWYDLVSDPQLMFDETLFQNVDLKVSGGKKPDSGMLAKMFNIERESYLTIVAGQSVIDPTCKPCQKLKKIKGTTAITYSEYQQYESFLIFENGGFSLNTLTINEHLEKFKTFASTPAQIETYKYWTNVCTVLNSLSLSPDFLVSLQKQLGNKLMYSYGDNKLHENQELLYHEILKIK
jgi:hypothetical protein